MGSRLSNAAVMKVFTESGVSAGVGRMSSLSFLVLWDSVMYTASGVCARACMRLFFREVPALMVCEVNVVCFSSDCSF